MGVFGEGRVLMKSRSRPQAILPSLHWNRLKDGTKTIELMVTIEKLLDLIYWRIFVRLGVPAKTARAPFYLDSLR